MSTTEERPSCKCHRKPMTKGGSREDGAQEWACSVKCKERIRIFAEAHPGRILEIKRKSSAKKRAQSKAAGLCQVCHSRTVSLLNSGACEECRAASSIRLLDKTIAKYTEQLRLIEMGHTVEEARKLSG